MAKAKLAKYPKLLERKIYKTGQTRGADDDQIFQNRVGRNSTVLIPFSVWESNEFVRSLEYENGYIVLIEPTTFFEIKPDLSAWDLELGRNCLMFYQKRSDWVRYHPGNMGYGPATSRRPPLGGEYVARIANTTSSNDARINEGFTGVLKGAGIRQYEYACAEVSQKCRIQLEALVWQAFDSAQVLTKFMTGEEAAERRKF